MNARYLSLIGPPGSGKTTQVRLLQESLPGPVLVASVPRLLRGEPELLDLLTARETAELSALAGPARRSREAGELAPLQADALLLRAAARPEAGVTVVFDGCPRGAAQARLFLSDAEITAEAVVIELVFEGAAAARSLQRQTAREVMSKGEAWARDHEHVYRRKATVYLEDTVEGLSLLRAAGLRPLRLSADLDPRVLNGRILEAAGARTPELVGGLS